MRAALISFSYPEYALQLASYLAQKIPVSLFLSEQQIINRFGDMAIVNSWLKSKKLVSKKLKIELLVCPRWRDFKNLLLVKTLISKLNHFAPSIIHYQADGHPWIWLTFRFLPKTPLVTTVHDVKAHPGDKPSGIFHKFPHRQVIRPAAQLIVHGGKQRDLAAREFSYPCEQISVIPHGGFPMLKELFNAETTEKGKEVLFFGRILRYKGLEYLIRAEPLISQAIPDFKIVIAGSCPDFGRYEQMMVNRKNFIVHNRYISDREVAHLFQNTTVVVLPYIEASQSGVVPMAFTFGRPVVVTDVGSISEVVTHGETGLVVPAEDTESLAGAIIQLLKISALRNRMKRQIEIVNKTLLSWEVIADRTLEVYKQALRDNGVKCGI
ncbi:MAG: glycosyltransferase family 4 protein [Candidatus Hodarchaeota archaeon]